MVGHECLFHQAGLAGFQGIAGYLEMVGVGSGYIHQVYIGVGIQLAIGAIRFSDIPFLGKGLGFLHRPRGDGIAFTSQKSV